MKKLIAVLIMTDAILCGYSQESGKNFIDQNYIEVTGYAEKQITPDRIYLTISINEKDVKGQILEQTEKLMTDKLQEIGIDVSKNLVIKDFISNFKNYWILKTDILQSKDYQLLVYDAKTVQKVIVELEKLGISNISIEKLDHSDIEKFRQDTRIEAIKNAREKANDLANAIGQEAGKALFIQENVNNMSLQGKVAGVFIRGYGASKNIYGSRAPEPELEFEKINLEYNILVRFELKYIID